MLRTWTVLLAVLAACGDKTTDTDTLDPSDSDIPNEDCNATIASIAPADDDVGVELDTAVVAVFSEAIDPSAAHEIAVRHAGTSNTVAGEITLAGNGLSVTFTPDAPLLSHSTYDVTARVCGDLQHASFDTVSLPVDLDLLPGRTWAMEISEVQWIQPTDESMSESAEGFVLMHVDSVDEAAPSMDVLTTSGGLVDGTIVPDCANLSAPPPTDLNDNPEFTVGPVEFVVNTSEGLLTVEGMSIDAAFTSDASTLLDIHMLGYIDPAQFPNSPPCVLVALGIGGTCAPCPSGEGDCIILEMTAPSAKLLPSMDLGSICAL